MARTSTDKVQEKEMKDVEAGSIKTESAEDDLKKDIQQQPELVGYDKRPIWLRVPFVSSHRPPPSGSVADAPPIPEQNAGWFSLLAFNWITDLLALGYARPLEASDLYALQPERSAALIADRIEASFEKRKAKADEWNARVARGEVRAPVWKRALWLRSRNGVELEKRWREREGRRKASLVWALNDAVFWWFWSGGVLKVIADTAQVTSPLMVKALITFATDSYRAHKLHETSPHVGRGVGLAIGLLLLQLLASACTHHFFYRASSTGVLLRGGLITAIYRRSLHLSSRARSALPNGKLVNHISTDVSRIDWCCQFFHMSWSAPIQLAVCLVILLVQLGPSALAGFGFFVLVTPLQTWAMKRLFGIRKKSMVWTDKRAKLLQELLGGMRVLKFFAWEDAFLARIADYRKHEITHIRSLLLLRSVANAVAMSLPALASVLSFVAYSLSGHALEPAVIFTSLTLFQLLRMPLMFLPVSFSAIADAQNAIERIYGVFEAEQLDEHKTFDPDLDAAIEVEDADFTWDSPPPAEVQKKEKKNRLKGLGRALKGKKTKSSPGTPSGTGAVTPAVAEEKDKGEIFRLKGINLYVPRGKLVAIVGPVGSGKTSLLEGLIGEMRRTRGAVAFGGSVGYCPQNAWIQNATIRENICFGRPWEEERYWRAVKDSCLEADLEVLPNGDLTEVGEKGISLSGGQKQRLNICRLIYCDTDIQIFDDPLSALDAHVGKAVFTNVLQNAAPGKTRLLVTHALHFLPQVDYIYTMVEGCVAERGTYAELMSQEGEFARFVREFGSQLAREEEEEERAVEAVELAVTDEEEEAEKRKVEKRRKMIAGKAMMQVEERNTGAISGGVYAAYIRAGEGKLLVPFLLLSLTLIQGATVLSSYWLVWWQNMSFNQSQGFYMGIYAMLGVSQAVASTFMGFAFSFLTYYASKNLHRDAITRVMHAPMSFFETTPLGRIMNRFAKDIDTIDNTLGDALRMFANTLSGILGAIILISIILPWFLIAVFAILFVYYFYAIFYRSSARELKRLDAILRSSLYSHFSESLSGLATIRAYNETDRFIKENKERMDIENRAYWLTVTNQRWLGIRLDFLGTILTFIVSLLTVGTRFSLNPAQTGVALSYIISVQQAFGWMVRQSAEVENDMNSVERIMHYATAIEQEAPAEVPGNKPPADWPANGEVEMEQVVMKYRPELPPVIKGISMRVRGGEKIGIVGRTGAGKSSIMTALFRIVELSSGTIKIDGIDISKLGLKDLRSHVAIIPQDALLFSGTLRSNLDPFGLKDDASLWDALKRSYLVEDTKTTSLDLSSENVPGGARSPVQRFTLDSPVDDEGSNLSIGQRSLVSLARALVKNSKVLILDEATASVDYETDQKIQDTIATQFADRTILCIAHRLKTIIGYDRICVMDQGTIAELDTPANLYQKADGIFRGMCERSSITLEDIKHAAKERDMDME
ncbi:hypothetical protein PUNSTDRAFT_55872 [Punctularia strigosozonata HHB-11173 SS5]|uniref:ABC transporter n=1 Tax=Punctularia strigosozonata (strain HHB-11173) TaxID=741275 RepID=R7S0Y0_PUNST|nr:uncharacterized protein PUNSTDRAFT_55872 [Punctularia strigosozonata HHB-11173 SS5]EIN04040.1 hypothetical protein PUNSTDRAFT_55872 [Punctularia strigosozonata HHB-11173 SS5]